MNISELKEQFMKGKTMNISELKEQFMKRPDNDPTDEYWTTTWGEQKHYYINTPINSVERFMENLCFSFAITDYAFENEIVGEELDKEIEKHLPNWCSLEDYINIMHASDKWYQDYSNEITNPSTTSN